MATVWYHSGDSITAGAAASEHSGGIMAAETTVHEPHSGGGISISESISGSGGNTAATGAAAAV
ncbi:MAG: hypothetical protein GY874_05675 [Desulfobacteraceae bacterium]|nr:hypothetical protein [Desulfobacteraceae bacterium]